MRTRTVVKKDEDGNYVTVTEILSAEEEAALDAEQSTAQAAINAENTTNTNALTNAKAAINSLTGKTLSSLTNGELLLLVKALMFKAGAIDYTDTNQFKVQDPAKWLFKI